jgi:hypothetical protein
MRYRIVLPPGWATIPLRSGTDEAIAAIISKAAASLDDDATQRGEQVAARLREAAAAARRQCGRYLYLPVAAINGAPIAASFVVADVAFGAVDPIDPAALVDGLTDDPNIRRTRVPGLNGVRIETLQPAAPDRGAPLPYRRVDYLLPVPDDADRWLVCTFTALRPGDETPGPSAILAELFDGIMSTFRWVHVNTTAEQN